ncbi:MAG: hypothetical protein MUC50_09110 [Myxococcota bacterium]|nr:hypothetical protein [Myxococcota bacterium]
MRPHLQALGRGQTTALRLSLCAGLLLVACRDREPPTATPNSSGSPPPTQSPSGPRKELLATSEPAPQTPNVNMAASERLSLAVRRETPGAIRSRATLPGAASSLRFAAFQRGVLVSVGTNLLLVDRETTRGLWAAGANHKVFSLPGVDAVYSPAFSELFALLPNGRKGWKRRVSHGRIVASAEGVYLLDASTLRKLSSTGGDEWYAFVPGARQLEGPFACDLGVVVQGSRGMSSEVVRLSPDGEVGRRLELSSGAVLLGATPTCDPIVWSDGKILALDERGRKIWGRATPKMPLCSALPAGQACVVARGDERALFELVAPSGKTLASAELPITGRLTTAVAVASPSGRARVIAACTDVTSPCARSDSNRGPFNALLGLAEDGSVSPLFKHPTGHIAFSALADGRLITASSIDGDSTSVAARDASNDVLWQAELKGRLTAGPIVEAPVVYVATCQGLACDPPFELFCLTLERPVVDTDKGGTAQ